MNAATDPEQITRASRSNLALAFISLPRERRADITVFYAWCRIVDDIADDPGQPLTSRRAALDLWKQALRVPVATDPPLAPAVRALIAKYRLPVAHFLEIIAGVEMDLAGASYATWDDLQLYCHRVASVVGLVSIEIFGCRDPGSRAYAEALGLALQLTNILRDVGEDWANGARIYLPQEDLARFGVTPADLAAGRGDARFQALLRFEAARARGYYAQAARLRPAADRRALTAAEIMRAIYERILTRMETDGFRVFGQRYRLSRAEKLWAIGVTMWRCRFD